MTVVTNFADAECIKRGNYVYFPATISWAKVFESNRDTADKTSHPGVKEKLEKHDGIYQLTVHVTDEVENFLTKTAELPTKGMSSSLWGEDDEGLTTYRVKREHFMPTWNNKETGEQGVTLGAPVVKKVVGDTLEDWSLEEDGLLGNGSSAYIKLSVSRTKSGAVLVRLEGMQVFERVEYEAQGVGF
jgi:hypothetical protein